MIVSRFFLFSTLLMLLLVGLGYLIWATSSLELSFSAIFLAIFISFLTAVIAYALTSAGLEKASTQFATLLILGMFAKMVVGIAATLIVALAFKPLIREFVFAYFISYFVFTTFEVYGLMRKLRA